MSLPNNVQIVLMQGKMVVLDTVILIAASNFHVFLTVAGSGRITKENFLLIKKDDLCQGASTLLGNRRCSLDNDFFSNYCHGVGLESSHANF